MKYSQIRKHYGSDMKAAIELKVTVPTLRNWKKKEDAGLPLKPYIQIAIEKLSRGKLKADKF